MGVGVIDSAAERAEVAGPSGASRNKLLREAEKEMARLERKRATLMDKIAAASDYQVQSTLGAELDGVLRDLAVAEETWLELAE